MPSVRYKVSGKVQGVGFRWFVRVTARRMQLAGWVRNQPDGTVMIEASGAQEKLDELRRALWRGPDGAAVEHVSEGQMEDAGLEFPFAMKK